MRLLLHRHLPLPLVLFACVEICAGLHAQTPAIPVSTTTNQVAPLPVMQPPLASFRRLLALSPAQREEILAKSPAEKRAPLLAKIREYEAMPAAARDESLKTTELHWYLRQFLQMPLTNRTAQLSQVPEPYRKLVGDRLNQWEILPPPLQKEVLAHETTRDFFLGGSRPRTNVPMEIIPPPLRQELRRLDNLQPEQRRQMYANFQHFFDLTAADRQAMLDSLPLAERQKVQTTLLGLDRLPPEQRKLGLQSLDQLARLTDEQRDKFFDSVNRWKQLSPAEKATWLKLVSHLPPMPPLPQRDRPAASLPLATSATP